MKTNAKLLSKILIYTFIYQDMGFPGGSDGKESACNAGDLGLIPGLGRSPGEGNGNPLQYSCLEKGNATHSSILAWRISWTEEPGRLQSMGLKRVRHYWATDTFRFVEMMLDNKQILAIFLYQFKMGLKAAETICNISNAFGPGTANEHTVQWWFKRFCKGEQSLEGEEHSDRPLDSDND